MYKCILTDQTIHIIKVKHHKKIFTSCNIDLNLEINSIILSFDNINHQFCKQCIRAQRFSTLEVNPLARSHTNSSILATMDDHKYSFKGPEFKYQIIEDQYYYPKLKSIIYKTLKR